MNKCEQYCRTIKRMCNSTKPLLPAEYQQVEYLQSNGQQYINIGSIANHTYFDMDLAFVNWISNNGGTFYNFNGIVGCNNVKVNNVTVDTKVSFYNTPGIWIVYNGVTMTAGSNITAGQKYNLYVSPTLVILDGATINTATASTVAANYDCYVFSCYEPGRLPVEYSSATRLYHLKTSSIDMYPCYRKSDVKPGFYDVTNDSFYPNAGTGEFYMGIPQNNVQLVNYIRSTGTQYIDTHINNWNNTLEYEITLSVEAQSSGSRSYFGAYDAWTTSGTVTPGIGSYISYRVPTSFAAGYSASSGTDIGIANGQTGTYSLRGNTLSWSSGTSTAFNRGSNFVNKETIVLCAVNGAGTIGEYVTTSIYGAKFWLDGNLIRDFKPALLQGVKPGLYDTVEHCFYPNAGTGEFIVGPDI